MRRALFLVPAALATLLTAAPALAASKEPQVVEMAVTRDGFVPDQVKVKAGQPVKLVVTRKAEITCATEIVMKDFGVNQPLPLNKTVTVSFTPKKAGDYRYSCAMGHISGVVKAQ